MEYQESRRGSRRLFLPMIPLNLYIPKAIPDHLPYRLALLTNPGVLTSVRRLFAKTESIGEMAMFHQSRLSPECRRTEDRTTGDRSNSFSLDSPDL
jgi:hypothetical protein